MTQKRLMKTMLKLSILLNNIRLKRQNECSYHLVRASHKLSKQQGYIDVELKNPGTRVSGFFFGNKLLQAREKSPNPKGNCLRMSVVNGYY